jgi:hypothetical protein
MNTGLGQITICHKRNGPLLYLGGQLTDAPVLRDGSIRP